MSDWMAKARAAAKDLTAIKFVCGSNVTAGRRDAVAASARKLGIPHVTIWSGSEFEEYLRLHAEFLLRRWLDGEVFPDAADEIRNLAEDYPG